MNDDPGNIEARQERIAMSALASENSHLRLLLDRADREKSVLMSLLEKALDGTSVAGALRIPTLHEGEDTEL